jgi:hypothetical protein
LIADYGCFVNVNGEAIDAAVVSPLLHNWHLRHGTIRRNRRRTS